MLNKKNNELNNLIEQTKKKEKVKKEQVDINWIIKILIISFVISFGLSFVSEMTIPNLSLVYFFISSFGTSVPSEFNTDFIIVGFTTFPPFAIDEIYFAICIGVKLLSPCPIAAFKTYPGPTDVPGLISELVAFEANTPVFSLGNSIPVFLPNPKCKAYFDNVSIPILSPVS